MSVKIQPWLVIGIIFMLGVFTGVALTIGLAPRFLPPLAGQQMKRHWMEHLVRRLDLTPDQQAKIGPILADAESKIQALHHDEVEHGSQIFKTAYDQISPLLTPEQKVELQKMESEGEKMFSGPMHRWGPPPGGPDGMHHHGGWNDVPPPPSSNAPTNAAPPSAKPVQ